MREYTPVSRQYKIEKNRYHELKSFCRQYRLWKTEVSNCYGLSGVRYNGVPSKGVSDPTSKAAERAMLLQDKIDLVERTCKEADPILWRHILINVTEGVSYDMFEVRGARPLASKTVFYEARAKFFWLLDKNKG